MVDRIVSVPDSLELPAAVKVPTSRLSTATAIGKDVIRMVPPLIITEEDVDKAVAIIADTIDSLSK